MSPTDRNRFVAALATEYGNRLKRFLRLRLRGSADAEDLAQEVFLRLLRVEDCDAIHSPENYLFTVASHVVHQQMLRYSSAPPSVDIDEAFAQLSTADDPGQSAEAQQRIENLKKVLAELPTHMAVALVLHRFEGLTIEEIARRLGVARPTAKKYIARALLYCRERTRGQGS